MKQFNKNDRLVFASDNMPTMRYNLFHWGDTRTAKNVASIKIKQALCELYLIELLTVTGDKIPEVYKTKASLTSLVKLYGKSIIR